jgi:hypothetical protein
LRIRRPRWIRGGRTAATAAPAPPVCLGQRPRLSQHCQYGPCSNAAGGASSQGSGREERGRCSGLGARGFGQRANQRAEACRQFPVPGFERNCVARGDERKPSRKIDEIAGLGCRARGD